MSEVEAPIEEHFIVRMPPTLASELRPLVQKRAIPPTFSIQIKDRQAKLQFQERVVKGTLVDLPCLIESLRSQDSKQFYKTGDIHQMLIFNDEKIKDFTWPDGLTFPLKNVRKTRFRKTVGLGAVEVVEAKVLELLEADLEASEVTFEVHEKDLQEESTTSEEEEEEETTAAAEDDFDLAGVIDETLEEKEESEAEQSDEEESDQEAAEEDQDDNDTEQQILVKALKNEIAQLELKLTEKEKQVDSQVNVIMKERFKGIVEKLRSELVLKREFLKKQTAVEEEEDE